ncbi:Substance-P receptor-like, partial [Homarus americanus]
YKALIHPLNTRWTKSRARLVIGCIWVFSVVISLVPLVVSDSERYDWDGEWYYECKENWPKTKNELYEKTYTVVLFVLTFALPVVGLGYTYLS